MGNDSIHWQVENAERWDRVFSALSAAPRRRIVSSLLAAPRSRRVPLPDAARSPLGSDDERLRIELHHRHLPILADAEYVNWSANPFAVERGPAFEEVAVVVESLSNVLDRRLP